MQNNLHELFALLSYLHPDVFTSSLPFDSAFDLRGAEHKASVAGEGRGAGELRGCLLGGRGGPMRCHAMRCRAMP